MNCPPTGNKMVSEPVKLEKPLLVGLHMWQTIKNIGKGLALAALAGMLFKIAYVNPKRHKYETFYRDYDAMASFERMKKAGRFQSCTADIENKESPKK